MEDEIDNICRTFSIQNKKQEQNLIDTLKQNCKKIVKDRTGKKPYTTINISRISNKKILPMALAYKKKWVLNTWDKFIIPKPFNKICIVWGDPLDTIINKIDTSIQQETLEKSLINITEIATNHIDS